MLIVLQGIPNGQIPPQQRRPQSVPPRPEQIPGFQRNFPGGYPVMPPPPPSAADSPPMLVPGPYPPAGPGPPPMGYPGCVLTAYCYSFTDVMYVEDCWTGKVL